jgi:hypothetical protein
MHFIHFQFLDVFATTTVVRLLASDVSPLRLLRVAGTCLACLSTGAASALLFLSLAMALVPIPTCAIPVVVARASLPTPRPDTFSPIRCFLFCRHLTLFCRCLSFFRRQLTFFRRLLSCFSPRGNHSTNSSTFLCSWNSVLSYLCNLFRRKVFFIVFLWSRSR